MKISRETPVLEPGFLRLDPTAAKELIARIRASSAFGAFAQILLGNALTRRLDLLSGDANYIQAREALVQSLGKPFTAFNPTGQVQSKGVGTIATPFPRFLRVASDGTLEVRLLPLMALGRRLHHGKLHIPRPGSGQHAA